MRPNFIDMLIYRLFYWRWSNLFRHRPDLREFFISNLKAYDVLDEGTPVKVTTTVSIERLGEVEW